MKKSAEEPVIPEHEKHPKNPTSTTADTGKTKLIPTSVDAKTNPMRYEYTKDSPSEAPW